MEKIKILFSCQPFKFLKWFFLILLGAFIILVIVRAFHFYNLEKTNAEVAKIHTTKLTLDDVMGKNLPPDPGASADKTIAGIDANNNGIRDDVELAVFQAYPNSAKTRAVLLQYALALQMETIQPFVNTTIATEVIREEDRANYCVADTLVPRKTPESSRPYSDIEKIDNFLKIINDKQLNTQARKDAENSFIKLVRSYSDLDQVCDIDVSKLQN
jgi:hypothetical protein